MEEARLYVFFFSVSFPFSLSLTHTHTQLRYDGPQKRTSSQKRAERMNNPKTAVRNSLTKIVDSIMRLDNFNIFREKVNGRYFPTYYQVVKTPMWLNKIRSNVREKRYKSRDEFLRDVKLLVTNSSLFNGPVHDITKAAQRIYEDAKRQCDVEAESFQIWEDQISVQEKRDFQKNNSFKKVGAFGGKGYVQGFDRTKKEEEKSEPADTSTTTTSKPVSKPLTLNVSEPPTPSFSESPTPNFSEPPTPNFSEPPTPIFSEPPTPLESNSPSSAMLMDIVDFESEDDEEDDEEDKAGLF